MPPPHPTTNNNNTFTPPTQKYTTTPPETLLWLHQLRRDQSATLSRIKNIESSLESFQSQSLTRAETHAQIQSDIQSRVQSHFDTQAEIQSVWRKSHDEIKLKLDEVVGRIGEVRSEMGRVREEELSRRVGWEERVEERLGGVLRDGLRDGFEGVMERMERELEKGRRVLESDKKREKGRDRGSGSLNRSGTTISTRISESAREWADRHPTLSKASPTPTPPPDGNYNENDDHTIALTESGPEPTVPSTIPIPVPIQTSRGEDAVTTSSNRVSCLLVIPQLCQNTQSLSSYMETGKAVLTRYPGAEQEAHIVRQFWNGLNNTILQRVLADKLESQGWKWNALEAEIEAFNRQKRDGEVEVRDDVCASFNGLESGGGGSGRDNAVTVKSSNTKSNEVGRVDRKKRKRREIPIVWPDENDEDEAILLAEIERRRLTYITSTR